MGKLVLFRADGTAQDIKLDRERITIGRRPDNDVCLAEPAVSGEHAMVVTILQDSFLEDLGSTNGTLVNDIPITKHFLHDGDEIDIGRQLFVYLADDTARCDAPPKRPDRALDHSAADGGVATPAPAVAPAAAPAASGAPRAKRRTDGAEATPAAAVDDVLRSPESGIAAGVAVNARSADKPGSTDRPPADPRSAHEPAVRVLTGSRAGSSIALTKRETLIGRAGIQVAALRNDAGIVRLVPVEGSIPPSVNGAPVTAEGRPLAPGDILEMVGARLEFVVS